MKKLTILLASTSLLASIAAKADSKNTVNVPVGKAECLKITPSKDLVIAPNTISREALKRTQVTIGPCPSPAQPATVIVPVTKKPR